METHTEWLWNQRGDSQFNRRPRFTREGLGRGAGGDCVPWVQIFEHYKPGFTSCFYNDKTESMCKPMNFSLLEVGRISKTTEFISILTGMCVCSVEGLAMFECVMK